MPEEERDNSVWVRKSEDEMEKCSRTIFMIGQYWQRGIMFLAWENRQCERLMFFTTG